MPTATIPSALFVGRLKMNKDTLQSLVDRIPEDASISFELTTGSGEHYTIEKLSIEITPEFTDEAVFVLELEDGADEPEVPSE